VLPYSSEAGQGAGGEHPRTISSELADKRD